MTFGGRREKTAQKLNEDVMKVLFEETQFVMEVNGFVVEAIKLYSKPAATSVMSKESLDAALRKARGDFLAQTGRLEAAQRCRPIAAWSTQASRRNL